MFVEIDGSIGEGGGQILRNAVALSAVLLKPVRIKNIRVKRSNPGLRPQHLTAVKAVAALSSAEVTGLSVGSLEISFNPLRRLQGGSLKFDAGTAGSTTLILQSLMPAMCYASKPVEVELRGGTNNPMAPPVEYLQEVLLPVIEKMGGKFKIELVKRGFYPRGGGVVKAYSIPVDTLKPIRLVEFKNVKKIRGLSYSCRLPGHIVERMANTVENILGREGYDIDIRREALQPNNPKCSLDPGCGIILLAELEGGIVIGVDKLGEKGVPSEKIGEEAAKELLGEISREAPVDKHLGDQLVIWACLAEGTSQYRVTNLTKHTTTSIELCRIITNTYVEVDGVEGEPATITIEGIGLRRE
ncbi:MAG: RNA 3'-terminal phosphate cyclase [Thaumarchaeota archaeon]|jgi:RNA 3'-terminal phosphate cyclase (ATP)|nr:RNA 3'-terminal phosphate cyclase [Candidatus Geocrenenecus arthurdayi]MCL7396301.1 RNA 3'-terminal phosphate cyclase [Candidatus Geocrenenecus arthurdayi]MCL7401169.1 RNA 3'-terminal phosphate cyclase [Candidatus Geocrenenecus arthurdayi]